MIFKRKKVERPKNRLGIALFKYDNIWNSQLKKIVKSIRQKKTINSAKADIVLDGVFYELDAIADDISRKNYKTDYRSDKVRDTILKLLEDLKKLLKQLSSNSFDHANPLPGSLEADFCRLIEIRQSLKNKMKDIESDYL